MPGTLYLVATPIGNLEDITLRALRILREADVVACEDTRRTARLLEHFDIRKPLVSYHEHNERQRASELLERLQQEGSQVALVSDAGSPLIADPGYRLVREAAAAGIRVEPVPGPSALVSALSASGLPTDAVFFNGFLPPKSGPRRRLLEGLRGLPATLAFYEAPHRILESLADCREVLGDRQAVLAREITKLHEEFLRGKLSEIRDELAGRQAVKGEITLLIDRTAPAAEAGAAAEPLPALVQRYTAEGLSEMDAIKKAARERGLSKREAYRLVKTAGASPPHRDA